MPGYLWPAWKIDIHHSDLGQLSPRQTALLAALAVTLLTAGVLAILHALGAASIPLLTALILSAIMFATAYGAFSFGIEKFIHSRIKVLYRTVHDLKRTRKDGTQFDVNGDVLGQVNEQVSEWATERRAEIHELEERERFRREFIGNLAHELKTPIFNIQGYILTLLEGGLEDEKVNRDFLNRASNGVDRLMKIVEDLDMITKLESGVMELDQNRCDLYSLVNELMESMEMQAKERGVTLVNGLSSPTNVICDRGRIAQVFINLLNNAINYGREGGKCKVTSYPLGDQVLVEVTDDGIGISEEHVPRLFERFYRVGKSRARNEGGSGLGLAIVKHIIEAHGQTISVQSREGEGTTFSFTLKKAS
jgi:two-component system phosphate regulon sensor histidine kinase PhoR